MYRLNSTFANYPNNHLYRKTTTSKTASFFLAFSSWSRYDTWFRTAFNCLASLSLISRGHLPSLHLALYGLHIFKEHRPWFCRKSLCWGLSDAFSQLDSGYSCLAGTPLWGRCVLGDIPSGAVPCPCIPWMVPLTSPLFLWWFLCFYHCFSEVVSL